MSYTLLHYDCRAWLAEQPENSLHAICTDPPYGLVEFSESELEKLRAGRGGIWRLPPNLNGSQRAPLPRVIARHPILQYQAQNALAEAGFEVRGAVI